MPYTQLEKAVILLAVIAGWLACSASSFAMQDAEVPDDNQTPDLAWPRTYEISGDEIVLYQPQLAAWDNYETLNADAAVVVTPSGTTEPLFGAIKLRAHTRLSQDKSTVRIDRIEITSVTFPELPASQASRAEASVRAMLSPDRSIDISVDRLTAAIAASGERQRGVEVSLDPPPIYFTDTPAILITFMGEPRFELIAETGLRFAVNTNWDILFDEVLGRYFLLDTDHWLATNDILEGPWSNTIVLPEYIARLSGDEWADVRAAAPGRQVSDRPLVFVSTQPAELITTLGSPQYTPITGTDLLVVSNTESDLFLHTREENFYFLTAGRWFRAPTVNGPWAPATSDLPTDFSLISPDDARSHVLFSVPGTAEADAAVTLASVPHKATVNREDVAVSVEYEGDPVFRPIDSTTVSFAVNTAQDVFRVGELYYCCESGIWFLADSPGGPWVVCDSVPPEIYTIPSSHPKHNVTYVYVYESTPSTVVVGQTSGYSGEYVAATGIVAFGFGALIGAAIVNDWDDNWGHYHYHSGFYSYGCGAHYSYHHGGYYYHNNHSAHGPHGGAVRWSSYDYSSGTYRRGGAVAGPRGAAGYREAYNPYTNRYAARAGGTTPYGSWSRGVVADGDDWIRGGQRSGSNGRASGFETSGGAAGVRVDRNGLGGKTTVARNKHGDLYVGRDGNIYRPDASGNWQHRSNGGWQTSSSNPGLTGNRNATANRDLSRTQSNRAADGRLGSATNRTAASRTTQSQQLQRQRDSRSRGDRYSNRNSRSDFDRGRQQRSSAGSRSSGSRSSGGRSRSGRGRR